MNGHAMEYCPKKISKFLLLHGHDKAAKKHPHQKHFQGTYLLESSLDGTKAVNPVI